MKTYRIKVGKYTKIFRIIPLKSRVLKLVKSIINNPMKGLSLGIIILGAGCISLYMYGMLVHANDFIEPVSIKKSTQSAVEASPQESMPEKAANEPVYPSNPLEGDNIGTITIPALDRTIAIYQGTGSNELSKGVGHFAQSVLPGVKDNCVLSGHNDSVFTKLDRLVIGDLLLITSAAGEFEYKITGIRIVDKDDRTVIVPTEEAVLTLTTCYPFISIGEAPERYIVSAELISTN